MDQIPSKTDERKMQVNNMCLYQTGGMSLQKVCPLLLTNNLLRMTSCVCMLLNNCEYLLNLMASLPFKVFPDTLFCFCSGTLFCFCSGTQMRRCGKKYIGGKKGQNFSHATVLKTGTVDFLKMSYLYRSDALVPQGKANVEKRHW